MVSDVALKRKFLASVKNWVHVQEGECSRGQNGSCVAFEVRRQLAVCHSFPELELKHQERWCLGAACAQNPPGPLPALLLGKAPSRGRAERRDSPVSCCHWCHHRGVWITMSPCKCSLRCQPFLAKVSLVVFKPSPLCHFYQCCCLSLFVVFCSGKILFEPLLTGCSTIRESQQTRFPL